MCGVRCVLDLLESLTSEMNIILNAYYNWKIKKINATHEKTTTHKAHLYIFIWKDVDVVHEKKKSKMQNSVPPLIKKMISVWVFVDISGNTHKAINALASGKG